MIMLNQPFHGQLGDLLCEKLRQPLGHVASFTMFAAFAKNSGVLRLKPALEQFKLREGISRRLLVWMHMVHPMKRYSICSNFVMNCILCTLKVPQLHSIRRFMN